MKKSLLIFFGLLVVCSLGTTTISAQDSIPGSEGFFQKFKDIQNAEERFKFFFDGTNQYNENSAYDWLDAVNVYLNNSQKINDSSSVTYYSLIQSQVHFDLGDYDKSLAILKQLFKDKQRLNVDGKAVLLDLMDQTYSKLKMYSEQIDIRIEKKELGLAENIVFYDIYSNLGLHREAMNNYFIEEQKNVSETDYFEQANFYNNVGTYLRLDKSFPTALSTYKKANSFINLFLNDILEKKSDNELNEGKLLMGIIEGNIGKTYTQLKQYEEAIPFLEKGIIAIKEHRKGEFSSDLVENTLEIAECYLHLENFGKTTDYLGDGLQPKGTDNILKKNRLLALYYDKTGDCENETRFLKKNMRIRDSINNNESELRKQQLATVMGKDLENSRFMMEEQKAALEKSRNEMVAKDEKINLVFISLIFTLLGFAGLVYAYLKSIKSQRLIAEQKHIIENSLIEKDSLLKEIHHRVKNNLQMVSSLLSLQTKNTRSKAAIEALEEGKTRVKAMALIHQKLYQHDDLSVIEMQGYIESLINSVQSVYKKGGHSINITIDAEGVELDIDRAIPFGLILNELVSNSFKYAFPNNEDNGKIYIHLRKTEGQAGFFEYTDNGVGFSDDSGDRTNSSMGIRLMKRLVNQLQSTLNIDKTAEGVRFWFDFK